MSLIETAHHKVSRGKVCEDSLLVIGDSDRCVVAVADGAGGVGSGDLASSQVIDQVNQLQSRIHSADEWSSFLKQLDYQISVGESTAVVVDIRPYGIAGASVGDSQAWIINDGFISKLTKEQPRKPLLGSRSARPKSFMAEKLEGLLIVSTDGLFDYIKAEKLLKIVATSEFYEIPRRLIEHVRLPSGDLWDDVGIVVARNKPQERTRIRYAI